MTICQTSNNEKSNKFAARHLLYISHIVSGAMKYTSHKKKKKKKKPRQL